MRNQDLAEPLCRVAPVAVQKELLRCVAGVAGPGGESRCSGRQEALGGRSRCVGCKRHHWRRLEPLRLAESRCARATGAADPGSRSRRHARRKEIRATGALALRADRWQEPQCWDGRRHWAGGTLRGQQEPFLLAARAGQQERRLWPNRLEPILLFQCSCFGYQERRRGEKTTWFVFLEKVSPAEGR